MSISVGDVVFARMGTWSNAGDEFAPALVVAVGSSDTFAEAPYTTVTAIVFARLDTFGDLVGTRIMQLDVYADRESARLPSRPTTSTPTTASAV